jgi:hypothetical protein
MEEGVMPLKHRADESHQRPSVYGLFFVITNTKHTKCVWNLGHKLLSSENFTKCINR